MSRYKLYEREDHYAVFDHKGDLHIALYFSDGVQHTPFYFFNRLIGDKTYNIVTARSFDDYDKNYPTLRTQIEPINGGIHLLEIGAGLGGLIPYAIRNNPYLHATIIDPFNYEEAYRIFNFARPRLLRTLWRKQPKQFQRFQQKLEEIGITFYEILNNPRIQLVPMRLEDFTTTGTINLIDQPDIIVANHSVGMYPYFSGKIDRQRDLLLTITVETGAKLYTNAPLKN